MRGVNIWKLVKNTETRNGTLWLNSPIAAYHKQVASIQHRPALKMRLLILLAKNIRWLLEAGDAPEELWFRSSSV